MAWDALVQPPQPEPALADLADLADLALSRLCAVLRAPRPPGGDADERVGGAPVLPPGGADPHRLGQGSHPAPQLKEACTCRGERHSVDFAFGLYLHSQK